MDVRTLTSPTARDAVAIAYMVVAAGRTCAARAAELAMEVALDPIAGAETLTLDEMAAMARSAARAAWPVLAADAGGACCQCGGQLLQVASVISGFCLTCRAARNERRGGPS